MNILSINEIKSVAGGKCCAESSHGKPFHHAAWSYFDAKEDVTCYYGKGEKPEEEKKYPGARMDGGNWGKCKTIGPIKVCFCFKLPCCFKEKS